MENKLEFREIQQVSNDILQELSMLLINVVDDGASIGFLPPLSMRNAEEYWKGVVDTGVILWIAKLDGDIVGSVQLHLCLKQNGKHRAEIAKLMVDPKARRMGVGRALMQIAEKRAKAEGRSLLVLDTRAGDPSNLLYKSIGYIEAGRIPKYAQSANGCLDETVFYYKEI